MLAAFLQEVLEFAFDVEFVQFLIASRGDQFHAALPVASPCRVQVGGVGIGDVVVADFFIDLGDIAELIRKDSSQSDDYEVPSFISEEIPVPDVLRGNTREPLPPRMGRNAIDQNFRDDEKNNFVRVTDEQ